MKLILAILISFTLISCASKQAQTKNAAVTGATKPVTAAVEASSTEATAAATHPAGATSCKQGADARTIAVEKSAASGCEVRYTKAGETNTIASATSDMNYCQTVADKIKNNLSAAGFSCE